MQWTKEALTEAKEFFKGYNVEFVREPTFEEELAFIEAEWLAEFTSEEEYMDWQEAKHEEEYLKWLAESEIVDGGAA